MNNADESYIAKKYSIIKAIGCGQFGQVYLGKHVKKGTNVAIKMESEVASMKTIKHESTILNYLYRCGCRDIPAVLWYGKYHTQICLVMDYFEISLESYIQLLYSKYANNMQVYLEQICQIMIRMIEIFRNIHTYFIVHRDIKPENFMIRENEVFLIDFGMATVYNDEVSDNTHRKKNSTIVGTPKYASYFVHDGCEYKYRDDLISLGYCYMYFVHRDLPWSNVSINPSEISILSPIQLEHPANILRKKCKSWESISCHLDDSCRNYLHHCYHNESNIDYTYLIECFMMK